MEWLVFIGCFGFVAALTVLFAAPGGRDQTIESRLEAIASARRRSEGLESAPEIESFWERLAKFFFGGDLVGKYLGDRRRLRQAGYYGEKAVLVYLGVRLAAVAAFSAAAIFFAMRALVPWLAFVACIAAAIGAGYVLPRLYITRKAARRLSSIQESLPDTLDLLVTCVEAGLAVDGAIVRLGNEHAEQGLAIGEELQLMGQELQTGVPRREALARLADRIGLEDVRSLTALLIQTEEIGGSIARSLRVYASSMREKRAQRAEEAARKMVVKLLFPLVLFIMPALFLIIMGPPAINIMKFIATMPRR